MKTIIKNINIVLISMFVFTACDLDVIPPADIAEENYWKTEKDAWYGLNACYATLGAVDIWDEMCTDNAHSHKPWEGNYELAQQAGLSTSSGYGTYNFANVRIANNFIEKVETCQMSDDLKNRMKAEARFFRAFKYLDLTPKFGKVAVITTVMDYDAPNVARDEVSVVQKFILDELAEIAAILPDSYNGSYLYEKGRITRAGALALRARAALYFGNYAEAEASSGAIISEGHHSLFRITSLNPAQEKEAAEMDTYIDFTEKSIDKDKFIKGMFSYCALWHNANANPTNPEYVVTREYAPDVNNTDYSRYTYMIPQQLSIKNGYSSYEPMQDLIDAYWDVDGKTMRNNISVEERKARYEEIWNDFKDYNTEQYKAAVIATNLMDYDYMHEFKDRDSRLYASILFPFKGWHETAKGDFYYRWDPSLINKNGNESWSGYSYRKLVSLSPYNQANASEDYPTIRYAEVLLTYAEARIQTKGWDTEIQKALNDLRDRCGMPDVPASFGSKQEALDFVRNERRIELAAEGHRFDDIRRYGTQYAQKVMAGGSYAPNGYEVVRKAWDNKMMLMPIPQTAMDLNPLLAKDQNPGY